MDRTVEYEYSPGRTLVRVRLPEVRNEVEFYGQFSYQGQTRPTLRYEYGPEGGVTENAQDTTALLHGPFAQLRLESYFLPEFVQGTGDVPRLRLGYDSATGRLKSLSVPDPQNQNPPGGGVQWQIDYPNEPTTAAPATRVHVRAPWGHVVEHTLKNGRIVRIEEELEVVRADAAGPVAETVSRSFTYSEDGRITSTTAPDGGRRTRCYADGTALPEHGPGRPPPAPQRSQLRARLHL